MNVGGIILVFIGFVLMFAGFRKTYQNWYATFTGKSVSNVSASGSTPSIGSNV